MKANAGKRKIFDAVDLLTEDTSAQTTEAKAENGVEQITIDSIKAFHNHPFHGQNIVLVLPDAYLFLFHF